MSNEIKITGKEFEQYSNHYDVLSDMDYGRNEKTGEYDVPAIEWDGPYGKHWVYFVNEESRTSALDTYESDMEFWVKKHRIEVQWKKEQTEKKLREIEEMKTLGGQFPELELLRNNL